MSIYINMTELMCGGDNDGEYTYICIFMCMYIYAFDRVEMQ